MLRDVWFALSPFGVGVGGAAIGALAYEVIKTLVWIVRYQTDEEFRRKMARARDGQ